MPYIRQEDRNKFCKVLYEVPTISNKGELEYLIFSLMMKYMDNFPKTYTNLHDCTYAAQHCSDEFRRRFLDEREDFARNSNGDIK
jgi:hypothetical protein